VSGRFVPGLVFVTFLEAAVLVKSEMMITLFWEMTCFIWLEYVPRFWTDKERTRPTIRRRILEESNPYNPSHRIVKFTQRSVEVTLA